MRLRFLSFVFALGLLSALIAAPVSASAAPARGSGSLTAPVTGTTATGGTFSGVLTVTSFAVQNGQLVANGLLSGTLTDPTLPGGTGTVANVPVTLPATVGDPSCTILDLTLGPLHLDLLGLVVDLNQVHLTITAQQGPGNLLGNLLCAVANLLNNNGTGALNGVAALLNRILAAL
jgi:hypothetical protein